VNGGEGSVLETQCEDSQAVIVKPDSDPRRWLALGVLLTGAFLPILDFTIVNLALPSIRESLRATSSEVQFVISAYSSTYAVMLITGGRLGDLYGRKRMFVMGVAGFTAASILCGFAGSPIVLILGRILQALMATLMAPQVLASIRVLFPGREQARALGLYGATFGMANICGQVLGGFLVSVRPFGYAWQSIFFVNVPIGLAAFAGGVLYLEENRPNRAKKLDLRGVVLLSLTLACLVYPLIEGRQAGWPMWMFGMLVVCVVAFGAFLRYENGLSANGLDPLVELSLFRHRRFALGVIMGLVFYMLSAFYLTFSIYLQGGLHKSPLQAGLSMLPFALSFFLGSAASSRIARTLKNFSLPAGFTLQVIGFGIVAASIRYQVRGWVEGLACAGIGYGIVMPGVIKAVIGGIDERYAGLASGIVMTTLQIGAALGVAIVGGVFYTTLSANTDIRGYANAFSDAMVWNVVLLAVGCALSLLLPLETNVET
jgi:EmrB/QacA subfamily drug resistance transporter